jgi:phospholipid/cholesterol/gamma-HCH transport system substrate-binding protein
VEEPFAPLRRGTEAAIRSTSLSGVANRYVALTPGARSEEPLDDGATLDLSRTTGIVDLDQLFNTLDGEARGDLQQVIRGFGTWYVGRGEEAGEAAEYLNPLLSSSRRLAGQLTQDEGALTRFLLNTSRAMTAIAERRDDLSALVGNANATARAIGSENAALARALGLLPTTLRRANTTFVNLRSTLDDLDVLVAESKPATRELAPFLRELRPLVADARPTIRDLSRLVRRSGADNDLVDATRQMPALASAAKPAFATSRRALQRGQAPLEFFRPYAPEFVMWLRDFGQGAAAYDANGHYARIQPVFGGFSFADNAAGGTLTPVPTGQHLDGFQAGFYRRCPGTASQLPQDGSAPFLDEGRLGAGDCDPTQVLPGP